MCFLSLGSSWREQESRHVSHSRANPDTDTRRFAVEAAIGWWTWLHLSETEAGKVGEREV